MKSYQKLLSISFISLSMLISGCTVTAERIYSVCKISDGITYCYKNNEEFYLINEEGVFAPTSSVGLKALPALHIIPSVGNYKFEEQLPGFYTGTLESVNHYVYTLQEELRGEFEVTYCDWNNIEGYVYSDTIDVRIIYNVSGQVRIYATDAEHNGVEPPYIKQE